MVDLIIFIILLILGYVFGSWNERKHFRSIEERERKYQNLFYHNTERKIYNPAVHSELVMGNVVISIDYFKLIVAGLRNIFGGKVSAYESLVDRARREAMLRLQEHSAELGAVSVKNVRYETSSLSKNARGGIGSIEVLAYGTALIPKV